MNSASLGRRAAATAIDFIVVPAVSFLVMLVTGAMETAEAYAGAQPFLRPVLLGVAGYLLVNGWLLHRRGRTLGKWIMGLRIVDHATGEKAALWKLICIRALFFPLLYLVIGYDFLGVLAVLPVIDLAPALAAQRRCLHDYAAGTSVVRA